MFNTAKYSDIFSFAQYITYDFVIYSIYNVTFSHLEYIILKKFVYLHREFEIKTLVKDQSSHSCIMYRIFICHSWSYSSDYDKIELFLRQEGIRFYNHSVPQNDPIHTNGSDKQLSDAIEAKVKGCSCVIILAGVYATYMSVQLIVTHGEAVGLCC